MEPISSFQGLATGIDFRELVDAIMQAASRPAVLLTERKTELDRETTAWGDVELRVQSALDRSKDLADPLFFRTYKTLVIGDDSSLSASAGTSAVAGSFSAEVLQLATREKVGSDVYQDRTVALGLTGEFVVGGQAVQLFATDSLEDVAQSINAAGARATSGRVTATVVGASDGGYRIVLTSADSGSRGVDLADGASGLLRTLGFVDSSTSIKHQTSDGAMSNGFKSASADIATLLGLSSPPASASVTIGSLAVTIDLSSDSLDDIASAINAAAAGAGSSISAQVVTESTPDGTVRRLDIGGTTSFGDTDGILETLGVLEASRSAVAHQVQGAAFTDGDAVTAATGATLLTNLWAAGADASVQVGDTLTLSGTHGDGTTFSKTVLVGAGDTYQDLLDELNSATDGFGVGSRTATASISNGSVVVTDDTAGSSRLAVSIVSHNEGGGTLDFGDFTTLIAGREREITAGVDAELIVDGAFYSRSSNKISDIVQGVTLDLSEVSTNGPVMVEVNRDVDAIVDGVEAFIKSFNAVSEFVLSQFTGIGAEEGESSRPLSGDRVVRSVRDRMRNALQTAISSSVSSFRTLTELGIEANQEGAYDIDLTKLRAAVENDPFGVERIFSAYGVGSVSSLDYVSAGDAVEAGTYDVVISTPAAQATVTGSGFGGTYVDDGTADTMTITDSSTASIYEISLSNGMTLSQIVDALNAELQTSTARQLQASTVMKSDAVGTDATDATLLQDLYNDAGTNLGIAIGDTFTVSGTGPNGTTFFREWTVSDPATQTLGTLRSQVAVAIGTDVVIDLSNGVLSATAVEDGRSTFTLSVSSDNAGGGTFSFGTLDAVEDGRAAATIIASDIAGELALTHDDYGSNAGFTVAYTAGGGRRERLSRTHRRHLHRDRRHRNHRWPGRHGERTAPDGR